MSRSSGDEAAERVGRAAARAGVPLDEVDAARLGALVERVEAALVAGPSGTATAEARPAPAAGKPPGVPADDPEPAAGPTTGAPGDGPAPAAGGPGAAAWYAPSDPPTAGGAGSGWVWRTDDPRAAAPGPPGRDGPLAGWRLAVKDIMAVAGRPLRCGSAATFDAEPEPADALVVARLRAAGARLAGTTRLHEFAFGTTGIDRAFGTPAHPLDPTRVPGGSSSGAAVVVATGEADLSLGTDTGGSVRIPAALCGVVGYKPSYGALSTAGVFALAPSLDHVGLLVASPDRLAEPAAVLGLVGPRAAVPGSGAKADLPRPRRLGVARGAAELCSTEVAAAFAEALDRLRSAGLELVEVDWPGGEEVFAATTAIMFAEAAHGHRRRLATRHRLYGADVRGRLLQGLALDADTYLTARDVQRQLRRRCRAVLDDVDIVVGPTVPTPAPRLDEAADPAVAARLVTFTRLADLVGLPAVSLPLPTGDALPVGLQIEGASDPAVIGAAVAVDEAIAS